MAENLGVPKGIKRIVAPEKGPKSLGTFEEHDPGFFTK